MGMGMGMAMGMGMDGSLATRAARLMALAALGVALSCRGTPRPRPEPAPEPLPEVAERFAWLAGEWVAEADGRRESETWVTRGDALHGTSESRVGDEIVHTEQIVIEARGDAIVYEARPSSQAPHAFTLVKDAPGRARFEDPAHDWPQTIEYVRDGDTLSATVSGTEDGRPRTATWTWALAR